MVGDVHSKEFQTMAIFFGSLQIQSWSQNPLDVVFHQDTGIEEGNLNTNKEAVDY